MCMLLHVTITVHGAVFERSALTLAVHRRDFWINEMGGRIKRELRGTDLVRVSISVERIVAL